MKNIRIGLIILLSSVTLFFLRDLIVVYLDIHNWYEIIASYFLFVFIPTTILGFLSGFSYRIAEGLEKEVAIVGLVIVLFSIFSFLGLLVNAVVAG